MSHRLRVDKSASSVTKKLFCPVLFVINSSSVDSQIERLLILQDRDIKRLNLITSLEAVPLEVAKANARIAEIRAAVDAGKRELQGLQVQAKDLQGKVVATEEQVIRYKTQQLQVKKNEEYQALTHEIETAQAAIGTLEDEELTLLLEIDSRQDALRAEQEKAQEEINLLEREITTLREREANLGAQRKETEAAVAQAGESIAAAYLEAYKRVGQRRARQPWVVPLTEHKCGGCRLKVSGEVESRVRDADAAVHCDSCGRILYWE